MIDPVDVDLNRHLNQLDRQDARSEAEDEKVEEWLADRALVFEALERMAESDLTDFLQIAAQAIVAKDLEIKQKTEARAIGWLEDGVREIFRSKAGPAVEADERQSEIDQGEAEMEAHQARLEDPMPGEY